MYKRFIILIFGILSLSATVYAQSFQTVRGTVKEQNGNRPIPYATIVLSGNDHTMGCTTDSLGNFVLSRVPIGRYDIHLSFIGYEPVIIKELLVSGGKETFIEVEMIESRRYSKR